MFVNLIANLKHFRERLLHFVFYLFSYIYFSCLFRYFLLSCIRLPYSNPATAEKNLNNEIKVNEMTKIYMIRIFQWKKKYLKKNKRIRSQSTLFHLIMLFQYIQDKYYEFSLCYMFTKFVYSIQNKLTTVDF